MNAPNRETQLALLGQMRYKDLTEAMAYAAASMLDLAPRTDPTHEFNIIVGLNLFTLWCEAHGFALPPDLLEVIADTFEELPTNSPVVSCRKEARDA